MNKTANAARAVTIFLAAIVGFNAAGASAGSFSTDPLATDGLAKQVVRFHSLDLSRMDGVATLYGRLRNAARAVCDPFKSREMWILEEQRACMDKAITDAVGSINRPLLSQYHQDRMDQTIPQPRRQHAEIRH